MVAQEEKMYSEQEIRDHSIIRALRSLYNDPEGNFLYGFEDTPANDGYTGAHFDIVTNDKKSYIGTGIVATDNEMTHHLILTLHPIISAGVFFPFLD